MGLYFPKLHEPKNCGECSERDPEYGGACMLMPKSNFETFDDQFACCPIISLIRGNTCFHTKPGDILIKGTVYRVIYAPEEEDLNDRKRRMDV